MEEEGAKRLVEVGRELEQVREHSQALQTQLDSLKVYTCIIIHVYALYMCILYMR